MKQTLLLTKVFFNSSIDFSRKKGKVNSSYIFLIGLGLLFAVILGLISGLILTGLLPMDVPKHSVVIMCLVIESFIGFILNFFSMYSSLFKAKDFDFLASSPLKKSSIITAKLLSLFLFSFIINAIGMIPVIITYMVTGGTAIGLLCTIVGTIFVGVVPLLASTIFGAIVSLLTIKLKNGDTITIIAYIVIFIGFSIAISISTSSNNILLNADKIFPYFRFLTSSFVNNDAMGILYFTLINIGGTILVVALTSLIYFPINMAKKNNGDGSYKSSKEKGTLNTSRFLFRKEVKMITKNPLFLLSTYAAVLIAFVMGIVFVGFLGKGFIERDTNVLKEVVFRLKYLQPGIGVMIASMCVPTYASFSMEGRDNFEQLFVYPLDKREIIKAKIKASLIPLSILFIVTNAILVLIFAIIQGITNIPVYAWLSIILFPVLSCISATLIGTLCGLKWIKLDFVDPNDILKKSKSMAMTLLFSCLLNLVIFAGFVALSLFVPSMPYLGLIVGASAEVIAIVILAIAVKKHSLKMLEDALIK